MEYSAGSLTNCGNSDKVVNIVQQLNIFTNQPNNIPGNRTFTQQNFLIQSANTPQKLENQNINALTHKQTLNQNNNNSIPNIDSGRTPGINTVLENNIIYAIINQIIKNNNNQSLNTSTQQSKNQQQFDTNITNNNINNLVTWFKTQESDINITKNKYEHLNISIQNQIKKQLDQLFKMQEEPSQISKMSTLKPNNNFDSQSMQHNLCQDFQPTMNTDTPSSRDEYKTNESANAVQVQPEYPQYLNTETAYHAHNTNSTQPTPVHNNHEFQFNADPNHHSKSNGDCMSNMANKIDQIKKIKRLSAKDELVKSNSIINDFLERCNIVVFLKCKVNNTEPIRIRKPYKLYKNDWFCANCQNINYNQRPNCQHCLFKRDSNSISI